MTRYKCPDCKEKKMEKQVYTEERCDCGHVNHHPHRKRSSQNQRGKHT